MIDKIYRSGSGGAEKELSRGSIQGADGCEPKGIIRRSNSAIGHVDSREKNCGIGRFETIDERQAQEMLQVRIKNDLFAGTVRSANPRFVLLVGQPGAGKTSAMSHLRQQFGEEGCVDASYDTLMTYHPNYYELTTKGYSAPFRHERMYEVYSFASRMREAVIGLAAEEGRNVVFENTFPMKSAARDIPGLLGDRFPVVELWALATPADISRLSTYVRYENQLNAFAEDTDAFKNSHANGPRRMTDADSLDRFMHYRDCVSQLHSLELSRRIGKAVILDRNGIHFECDNFAQSSIEFRRVFLDLVNRGGTESEFRAIFDALPDMRKPR
ncbi:zeta toxin family protein [Martelella sp. HB161492]|uniref:zeta toxin family protein n=1 Tax=Martelella sp. HB161492 TaxID=2720726 RepID=UPI0015908D10|nr:zeta toxin family protein [Martelella sp. HB161492]